MSIRIPDRNIRDALSREVLVGHIGIHPAGVPECRLQRNTIEQNSRSVLKSRSMNVDHGLAVRLNGKRDIDGRSGWNDLRQLWWLSNVYLLLMVAPPLLFLHRDE